MILKIILINKIKTFKTAMKESENFKNYLSDVVKLFLLIISNKNLGN